jgi:hypothetical protein
MQADRVQPRAACEIMKDDPRLENGAGSRPKQEGIPGHAFISPDEPLVTDQFRQAIISPDDPIPPPEDEAGIVVGMDGSPDHEASAATGILDTNQVASVLSSISADLRERGINGLQIEPATSEFEEALKVYLSEYFINYS